MGTRRKGSSRLPDRTPVDPCTLVKDKTRRDDVRLVTSTEDIPISRNSTELPGQAPMITCGMGPRLRPRGMFGTGSGRPSEIRS